MAHLDMDVDAALSEVPVNLFPLVDDTDFKTREVSVAYNATGMDLVWNFVTCAGAFTQTAVTPTSSGNYDWTNQGKGYYTIEIPASGGASINNDTEGFGWFSGVATGVLPWVGPIIRFRAAALNDALIDGGDNLDVNAVQCAGTILTARDLGASVLLSPGTGTGQLDFTSGVVKSNLVQILASAITGTAAQIAAAFAKFFDKATPTGTVNSLPDAVPGAAGGLFIAGANAATSVTTALTANITGNLSGSVGSVTGAVGSVTGAVGSVTGNVGGDVVGAVGSVTTPVTIASGQIIAKKNVALANFTFPMYDSSGDLITGRTVTVTIIKDGGTPTTSTNSPVEVGSGAYKISFTQAEMNADTWMFIATATGAKPTTYTFLLQP